MEHPHQKWQHFISNNHLNFKKILLSHFPYRKSQLYTQKYHKPEPRSNFKDLNTKNRRKILRNLYQISPIATNELFLCTFFSFSKKSCWGFSEAALSTSHFLLFIECLRYVMSNIMKAHVYCTYKILTGSREDSSSWPREIFCKTYIVSLCPRLC